MTCQELRDPVLSASIARKLAKIHQLDVPINKEPTWLFDTCHRWLDQMRSSNVESLDTNNGSQTNQTIAQQFHAFDFEAELTWLQRFLNGMHLSHL